MWSTGESGCFWLHALRLGLWWNILLDCRLDKVMKKDTFVDRKKGLCALVWWWMWKNICTNWCGRHKLEESDIKTLPFALSQRQLVLQVNGVFQALPDDTNGDGHEFNQMGGGSSLRLPNPRLAFGNVCASYLPSRMAIQH